MHHASVSRSDRSTLIIQKKIGVYESGHSVDIHSKVDLLTQKLDQILTVERGQVSIFTPPTQQKVCSLCSSLTHFINDYTMAAQCPEFVQEQVQASQDLHNAQNQPNFSWRPQPQPPKSIS